MFQDMTKKDPRIWETNKEMKCGSGPFCYDDKSLTMCRIDESCSENCGPFDFVVEGLDHQSRTGDVWSWFMECSKSYGCTKIQDIQDGSFNYDINPKANIFCDGGKKALEFQGFWPWYRRSFCLAMSRQRVRSGRVGLLRGH